jgi:predicted tellurium resistance membrane protein TerC
LLLSITWVMRLTADLFVVFGQGISGRDLILFFGGLFLLWKSSQEMYHALEGEDETRRAKGAGGKFSTPSSRSRSSTSCSRWTR